VTIRRLTARPSRRGAALAAAVLVLGLSTGAGTAAALSFAERDAASAALALRTAGVRTALDTTFQRYADTMHDLVAAAATQPADTVATTVARIVGQRLPGAHQVLVVAPDNTVTTQYGVDGSTPPQAAKLTAEPELVRAMGLARLSGRLVASSAHVLPGDLDLPPAYRQPAFVLAAPVHAAGIGFRGWVLASVRAGDLLEASLGTAGVRGVAAELTETFPDGTTRRVARWAAGAEVPGDRSATVDVALAGHIWQVLVRPTTALTGAGLAVADLATLTAGVIISLLLAGIVLAVTTDRERAELRAARAAEDASAAAERARAAEDTLRDREAELAGFAAVAGEYLQVPLNNIAGFTELLLEEAPQLDEPSRGFLDRIGRSTQKMLGLVDELLAYTSAADAALRPEPVDAGQLTAALVAEQIDAATGERPSVDVGQLPVVTADAALLHQVLDQLVGNAIRFVRHGGAARVTVSARPDAPGWWRIEVADRGVGVPAEHRGRIFAPFHRAPAAEGFPGNGLGLAICDRIVSLHGGRLGVEPNPGGGSIFWFTILDGAGSHPSGERPQLAAGHA
jgi:signal transduction histidine kinase